MTSARTRLERIVDHAGPVLGPAYAAVDWESTTLGSPETWPPELDHALDLVLGTRFPASLCWGPDLVLLYNEAYSRVVGSAHPAALGRPYPLTFTEAWDDVGPHIEHAFAGLGATWAEDALVPLERSGYVEQCWFTFSCSPVRGPGDAVSGVLVVASETTATVLRRRRTLALTALQRDLADATSERSLLRRAVAGLAATAPDDLAEVSITEGAVGEIGLVVEPAPPGRGRRASIDVPTQHPRATPRRLVVRLDPRLPVDDDYRMFVSSVATTLGTALDAVLVRDSERRISEALQRSLLTKPQVTQEVEVAVRYEPASVESAVGGDWYDAFGLPDGAVALVVGDVAGHDQHAAAVMGQLRNLVRGVAYAGDAWLPSQVLGDLDRAMDGLGVPVVATSVVGVLEEQGPDGYLLHWCNAGHPPPLVLRADGAVEVLDAPGDVLLGVEPSAVRSDHRVELAPGDTVLLYSDGLVERRDRQIDAGVQWLAGALARYAGDGPEAVCTALLEQVAGHEDDVVLLAVRPRPLSG
ncbi:PP2C family protein-serine/threonine phosphatase [Nocardioides sp. GY 10127]|uniref:PP2C family protein-serine/threonine phosphatase n=1 Tax=Nocardioides sp. GY 10127 TaxID=2569762 RepID=UPI0010A912C4|nr:PP2C family protein-serine/threonine phosphatase [Nocardioides sp. GY 10127]TIC84188.1 serine/threonine-protein phosphatase [Nocardioides sp. GY 10127]